MLTVRAILFSIIIAISLPGFAVGQHPPAIGYLYPPAVPAGQTTEVILGGYDWTSDMQLFVHDPRIRLEIIGPLSGVIVPEPPYWFGKKARRPPFPLPREIKAKLTIPPEVPPGIVRWQAANANGATGTGKFIVSHTPSVNEHTSRTVPQKLESLPIVVSGQIRHISEVDEYIFTARDTGPVTCSTTARRIGSKLNAVLEVRDKAGVIVAEAADTAGKDTVLTFFAKAGEPYTAVVYDLDFRGNRAFVYQLAISPESRIVAAIPSVGRRGETRMVELVGYGLATGRSELESVTREVTFPDGEHTTLFPFELRTEFGNSAPFMLHVSDQPQLDETVSELTLPCGVTGVLDSRFGEDRYQVSGKKDEVWTIDVSAERLGSEIDVVLAVFSDEGQELVRHDDLVGSTDAALEYTVPADGQYQLAVTSASSHKGTRAAIYHLSIQYARPDFTLSVPELLNVPIGGKGSLAVNITRRGGFQDPVELSISGLPRGVTTPDKLVIPANQTALNVELTVAADAPASASLVHFAAIATIGDGVVQRTADPTLVATTMKPPFSIDAEGKDDVTKWPRGTTFPAPVLVSRDEDFDQDIVLEMTSGQSRHRQGICGPELVVKPEVTRILYPVFLPEWLETTRTSRMVVNGVAKVTDPQGNIRYSVSKQKTRMGFLPTGALLKISADENEFLVKPGQQVPVPLSISRSDGLTEPLLLELSCDGSQSAVFAAEPQNLTKDVLHTVFPVVVTASGPVKTEHPLKIRATLLKDGHLPVVSETAVLIELAE